MKRSVFQNKPRKPLKRSSFKVSSGFCTKKRVARQISGNKTPSKTKPKGYQVPKWFKSLKQGSHGQTIHQKKYWKVLSDTYRQEDFEKYKGKCVSCPIRFERWQDGQLGHYKAWSVCNAWFKYERKNLALQCGGCNRRSDGPTNENFKQELKRRHGEYIIDWIETENLQYRGQKMEVWEIVERTEKLLTLPL